MQFRAAWRVSRCFSASGDSSARNPASDTRSATCCHAAVSVNQSQGMLSWVISSEMAASIELRCLSSTFCASLSSSASCSELPTFFAPLPRPLRLKSKAGFLRSRRSAAQRMKKIATFAMVLADTTASFCLPSFLAAFCTCALRLTNLLAASMSKSATLSLMPSSNRGHACKRANRSEKLDSCAKSWPCVAKTLLINLSNLRLIWSESQFSTSGKFDAHNLSSAG
mmetsp:Transcript_58121/g.138279  ORF Transcript_58121/g.138279 Transcript_58121/m.138279 type:complete len:225 (+) Transcript_58121:4296-4970(+)